MEKSSFIGTYKENLDISTLSYYNGYTIEDSIKDIKKFVYDETTGSVIYGFSDNNARMYTVYSSFTGSAGTVDPGYVELIGDGASLLTDVDLSEYNF